MIIVKIYEFNYNIGDVIKDDKRDLVIINRKRYNGVKRYQYRCNVCEFESTKYYFRNKYVDELWITEDNLLKKNNGCACCSNQIVVEGINDIPTTAPWMIPYFQGGYDEAKKYTKCSGQKIIPVCPDCGEVKHNEINISKIYNRKHINCFCKDHKSYSEKFMYNLLTQLNENFNVEVSFDWMQYKKYKSDEYTTGRSDFVIESKKLIIETDGGFHKKYNSLSKQTVEESNYIDTEKDKLATNNGYKTLRIDCDISEKDYIISSILDSELVTYYNLSNIDWNKCDEYANSNVLKEICRYKSDNKLLTTKEIARVFKIDKGTVCNYLKIGNKNGWCDYDSHKELIKSNNEKVEYKIIPIYCQTNNVYYRTMTLASEMINVTTGCISRIISGKQKQTKGFTFNKITREQFNEAKQKGLQCFGDYFTIPEPTTQSI